MLELCVVGRTRPLSCPLSVGRSPPELLGNLASATCFGHFGRRAAIAVLLSGRRAVAKKECNHFPMAKAARSAQRAVALVILCAHVRTVSEEELADPDVPTAGGAHE